MLRRYYNHKSKLVDRPFQVEALIRSFAICITRALSSFGGGGASAMQLESYKRAEPARQSHDSISDLAPRCLKRFLRTKPSQSCPAGDGKQCRSDPHLDPIASASSRESNRCDESACYREGKPVDLFHGASHAEDNIRRRPSMSFHDADNGRPSASAHNSRTFSSAMNALNSCFTCTVEGIWMRRPYRMYDRNCDVPSRLIVSSYSPDRPCRLCRWLR